MSDEMTDERLAEIRERANAATAGPWYWRNSTDVSLRGARMRAVMTFRRMGMQGAQPEFRNADGLLGPAGRENLYGYPDAAFIAHARQDIPDLLAEVERLREQVKTLQAEREGAVRLYVPAYREANGYIDEAGTITVIREHAEAEAADLNTNETYSWTHEIFVATRLHLPWLPVAEGGPTL